MATAVRAHSRQNGPPFLKVAQQGLTKTKAWEGKLIRGRSLSDEIWRDREKIGARFPTVCRHLAASLRAHSSFGSEWKTKRLIACIYLPSNLFWIAQRKRWQQQTAANDSFSQLFGQSPTLWSTTAKSQQPLDQFCWNVLQTLADC